MKPFNIEDAKAGRPIVTRNGYPVKILSFDRKSINNQPIIAVVSVGNEEIVRTYRADGCANYPGFRSSDDLFIDTPENIGYVNMFRGEYKSNIFVSESVFDNEDVAKAVGEKDKNYIQTCEIKYYL